MSIFKDRKKFTISSVLFLGFFVTFVVGSFSLTSNMGQLQKLEELRHGLSICSSRVNQSLVAFQSGQLMAKSLKADFVDATDKCFGQIKNMYVLGVQYLAPTADREVALLTDGVYVLNQRLQDSMGKSSEQRRSITATNQLTSQFIALDNYRYNVDQELTGAIKKIQNSGVSWKIFYAIAFLGMSGMIFFFLVNQRKTPRDLLWFEKEAEYLSENFGDNATRMDKFFYKFFNFLHLNNLHSLHVSYIHLAAAKTGSAQEATRSPVVEIPPFESFETIRDSSTFSAPANFQEEAAELIVEERTDASGKYQPPALLNVLEAAKDAVKRELAVDQLPFAVELDREFKDVELLGDKEIIEQLFYSIFSKISHIPASHSTLTPKVTINSSSNDEFGRISFKIDNLLFSANDLNYISSSNSETHDMNNMMIKQLTADLNGEVYLKNILVDIYSDSQQALLEVNLPVNPIFEEEKSMLTSVFKGTKRDWWKKLGRSSEV